MKTTYRKQEKEPQEQKTKPKIRLSHIFDGEVFMSEYVKRLYPYIFMVICLITAIIINEQQITKKQNKIKKYENEYKEALSKLKKNNQFIPYQESQELLKIIEERGFVKNDKNRYKIVVKEAKEE
ncbi:MAG: hypothetical protein J6W84_03145 [Bacteroidales bacterium]|nr:hypothetical protein [Bacteroidales bacterium]